MTTTRLSWERSGSGQPLVPLQGIDTTRHDFLSLRKSLEDRYEVPTVDFPGHGDSSPLDQRPTVRALAEAIEADLDAFGVGRVHILGDSLGARIAIELARRAARFPWWRSPFRTEPSTRANLSRRRHGRCAADHEGLTALHRCHGGHCRRPDRTTGRLAIAPLERRRYRRSRSQAGLR